MYLDAMARQVDTESEASCGVEMNMLSPLKIASGRYVMTFLFRV